MSIEGPPAWSQGAVDGFGLHGLGGGAPFPARAGRHATVFEWVETALVGILLLMLSSALLGRLGNPDGVSEPPSWLRQMWLPAYGVIALLAAARLPRMPTVWLGALVMLPIIAWVAASSSWSINPEVSSRRSVALAFSTLFALYLAARFDWLSLMRIVAVVFVILGAGSLFAAVAIPSFGVHITGHPGAWRGLFFEKNALGGFMVSGALACLTMMVFEPRRRWLWLGFALMCALLVVKSTSTTALLGVLVVFAGVIALVILRRGRIYAVGGLWLGVAAAIAVLVVFAVDPDFFFQLVGKDSSLTGRTSIWAAIMRQVALRPWQGYGYGAFWGSESAPAAWVALQANWKVMAADNAWADILVQVGWTGIAMVAFTFAAAIPFAAASMFKPGPAAYWAPLFLITLLLNSITESIILRQNDLVWVLFVATVAKLLQRRAVSP